MEKLVFDSGVKEYKLGTGGVLRFNPSDPNVYARFMDAMDKIRAVETDLVEKAKGLEQVEQQEESGAAVLRIMRDADRDTKKILSEVFGADNDFEKILGGVNVLAVAGNGQRVIANLLAALQPIMVEGAEICAKQQTDAAVAQAKQNRAQRRGQK